MKKIKVLWNTYGTPLFLIMFMLFVWEAGVFFFAIPSYLLPSPTAIGIEIHTHFLSLLDHFSITMLEAVLGFLLGNTFGFVMAVIFVHSPPIKKAVYPLAIGLKAAPTMALAPLIILWTGTGIGSKVVISALLCFFPIVVNSVKGLGDIERESLQLFQSLSSSTFQLFIKLRFPHALPYIFSALKISSSVAVVTSIVAEFAGAEKGLGYLILISSYAIDTTTMFSAIIAASLGGILFFGAIVGIERYMIHWKEP